MGSLSPVATTMSGSKSSAGATTARKNFKRYIPMYLSVAPFFILYLVFGLLPSLFTLYLSFQKWDGIGEMKFIGLNNFIFALTDPKFGKSIINTFLIWFMSTIPMLFLALLMAFLLNQRKKSKFLYQVAFFLPYVTSIVAITLIFNSFYGSEYGLINVILRAIHLPGIEWLSDPWGIKWSIAIMVIWRWTGYNALIYMAGLQSIPTELYEAARIDGASTKDIFFHITLPLLRPVILFTVISSTIGGMTLFTEPQVMLGNGGGPAAEGLTMSLYQYGQAFVSFRYGYGAAVSWLIFLILLVFTFINWKVVNRGDR
ncbi:cellobiose transport system permease protein [Thermosporothrix hazakensis]|jgi:cellobiose transport system permease protein|uniref:Cellobiose transport system permease protein n=1 Tax=Thermosporothrix hazakensis TaxID=644383 RepID=A0A326UE02_THEHA|nr:sugar ABC transporter permease [Thermosporothrix hazakensis]PZW36708.1 cellobiose transport system permease protein [Thermosporothrix hazakensis]GCE47359.1 cytochrome c biogenesis protein [Thermosporothrix hazakensis]